MTSDLSNFLQALSEMTFVHLRRARLTVASSLDVGLSVPNRSIHKFLALPPRDSGYTSGEDLLIIHKG